MTHDFIDGLNGHTFRLSQTKNSWFGLVFQKKKKIISSGCKTTSRGIDTILRGNFLVAYPGIS